MDEPVTTSEAITMVMKGESTPETGVLPFVSEPVIPAKVDTKEGEVQIFITDFVFNSTLYSAFQAGLLQYT